MKNDKVFILVCTALIILAMSVVGLRFYLVSSYDEKSKEGTKTEVVDKSDNDKGPISGMTVRESSDFTKEVTGLSLNDKTADDGYAGAFMKDAFNWTSYKEYKAARGNLMKKYGLKEDDHFMRVFFPDASEEELSSTLRFASSLNLEYVGMESHVTEVGENSRTYLTEVILTSTGKNGGKGYSGTCIVTYTVDDDGKISNIDGHVTDL